MIFAYLFIPREFEKMEHEIDRERESKTVTPCDLCETAVAFIEIY